MTATPSMPAPMPTSKKRCWTLIFKDIKNNVEETELLSSFRKRYTSARKLAFRSPEYTADAGTDTGRRSSTATGTNNDRPTETARRGKLSIDIQFTGPQPAEGPVGLMCNLLQATFVEALPVQLDRGRKRKLISGAARPSPTFASPRAASPRSSMTSRNAAAAVVETRKAERMAFSSAMETGAEYDAARTARSSSSGGSSFLFGAGSSIASRASSSGSSNFELRCEPARSVAAPAASLAPASMASSSSETDDVASTTSTTSNLDDLLELPREGGRRSGSGTGGSGVSGISDEIFTAAFGSVSLIDDLLKHPREGRGGNASAACPTEGGGGGGGGGSVENGAFASTLPGESLGPVSSAAAAAASNAAEPRGDLLMLSRSGRSSCSGATAAGEELPKWDEVVRRAATTAPAAAVSTESLPESAPGLAATASLYECKDKAMSQEETVALFADHAALTAAGSDGSAASGVSEAAAAAAAAAVAAAAASAATAAATAAGGVVVSEDGLWDGAPEDAYSLFSAPPSGRPTSFCWGRHPAHAATAAVVADDDDTGDDHDGGGGGAAAGTDEIGVEGSRDRYQEVTTPPPQLQQYQPQRSVTTSGASTAIAAPVFGGVDLAPVGSKISFAWREEECDFDGCCRGSSPAGAADRVPPLTSTFFSPTSVSFFPSAFRHRQPSRPCEFALGGLRSVVEQGHDFRDLTVCAHFFVDPAFKVEREAGPLEVDAATGNDRATAAVAYPSIWDIWPEVHKMAHVRAVEVDMHVELRSSAGEVVHSGPTFKVTYQRPATSALVENGDTACRHVRRISSSSLSSSSSSLSSSSSSSFSDQEDGGFGLFGGALLTDGVDLMAE